MESEQKDIGVIVGRFQVHELHHAHKDLIQQVANQHKRVLVLLGVTSALITRNNPLDFVTRKEMILKEFPGLTVLALPDMASDAEWSKELDNRVREACPVGSVVLYGGRDSFIPYYFGHFETRELEQKTFVSGTEVRKDVSREVKGSGDFRAGVIFAAYNQYPKVFPTVDVAIFKEGYLLLGKKPHQEKFRFIGGFSDPEDDCYETAAKREVMEETNIVVENVTYVGSTKIDDWRYRKETDKIITLFFKADYASGEIQPQDDISEIRLFELSALHEDIFVKEHIPLFNLLKAHLNF